jgi:hypothetical protein
MGHWHEKSVSNKYLKDGLGLKYELPPYEFRRDPGP